MLGSKKGMISTSSIVTSVITAVVIGVAVVALWPTILGILGNFSGVGNGSDTYALPLAGLFSTSGVIAILFSVGIFYAFYKLFWKKM